MQIKIHPLFFVLALILILLGQALSFLWAFLAVCLHELGHAVMARARGFTVKQLVLLPYGAMMCSDDEFDRTSSVLVGLAGPAVNLLLACIVLALWWLFPAVYPYTKYFLFANLSIGLFNLLPVYPLDGSRAVLGFAKNRMRAVKYLQIAGIAISFVMLGLFILSAFYSINFTLGIISVFLFFGATSGTKEEMYISTMSAGAKKYDLGVQKRTIRVSADVPIARLFHHINSYSETTFEVVDVSAKHKQNQDTYYDFGGKGAEKKVLCIMDEARLRELARNNKLTKPIKDALAETNK